MIDYLRNSTKTLPSLLSLIFILCKIFIDNNGPIGNFQIFQGDYRNMYPYIEIAQVTGGELGIICLIPLIFTIFIAISVMIFNRDEYYKLFYNRKNSETNLEYIHKIYFIMSFIYMCLTCTMMFTEVIKNVVTMPRPNFMGMCDYKKFNSNYTFYLENVIPGELVNLNDCYANKLFINDSISSFPSGHSSYSFSICCSFYLLFRKIKRDNLQIITFCLTFLSFYVGISRIMDYYHNVWDVLFGYFIAVTVNIILFSFLYIPDESKENKEDEHNTNIELV